MKKKVIFPFWLVFLSLPVWGVVSLSDRAEEELKQESFSQESRNPFLPVQGEKPLEPSQLYLEGSVVGNKDTLALVSGRIVREQDRIGEYTISKIAIGKIHLKNMGGEEYMVPLEGYVEPMKKPSRQNYSIEFRNADLKNALHLLSKVAGYNMIVPEDITGRVTLSFEDSTLRNAMSAILRVNNYSYATEGGIVRVGRPDQFAGGTDLPSVTISLKYATALLLVDKVKPLLSDKGSVVADPRTNILSVKDYDGNIASVRNFLASVDKKDRQVLIEAHIVDASDDFSRALGIQWGFNGTPGRFTVSGADSTGTLTIGGNTASPANVNLGASSPTSGVGLRIGRLPGASNLDIQLTAAEQKGDIKIISKPTVSTLNNMPAKIRSGTKIHVKSTSNISVGTSSSDASASQPSLQVIETGIQLDVTPQISSDDHIRLTIQTTESEADFSKMVDGIPAIIDNTASTTVFLKDGETAVIAGLLKTKETDTQKSVPGISKIPIIGNLFKSKSKTKTKSELIVFITPKIIP